jgi:hypothetical protein
MAMSTPRASGGAAALTRRRFLRAAGPALGALAASGLAPLGARPARAAALHRYLGNYPSNRTTGWTENIQGVTHDGGHWFFTQTKALWKFPVAHDLNLAVAGPDPARGILRAGIPAALADRGYDHFGDLDHYTYRTATAATGYLFVPVEGGDRPAVAVFRPGDLRYLGHAPLPGQSSAGWCAINPANRLLYSSNWTLTTVRRYRVDFAQLAQGAVALTRVSDVGLYDEAGAALALPHVQGGAFRPDGGRLYLVNGYLDDTDRFKEGVQVFDAAGVRIARSTNGYGEFDYEYHPADDEEPEGLTYWDLSDGRAPGVRGVLHVLMLDNDGFWSADDLYFKHYA